MGKVATSPLPPGGSPPLQSGAQNQKGPINGQGGYVTRAASGIPTASERGADRVPTGISQRPSASIWLSKKNHMPIRKITFRTEPPRPPQQGCITCHGDKRQKLTCYGNGISRRPVAHKWARWLHHPCRLGDPHRFKTRGKNKSGP